MNERLVTVLVGAAIGACVGAFYAWAYLWLRDEARLGPERLDEVTDLPNEPTAVERKREASVKHQERMAQARAYRQENPEVSWPEAIRRARQAAQNGGGEVAEDVPA